MNRRSFAAVTVGAVLAATTAATALPAVQALAQGGYPPVALAPPMGPRTRARVIPWSYADSRPRVAPDHGTGLFIWHDRNTVHVESTDNHWFGDNFEGSIEIRGGKFDNVQNEHSAADTRYRQTAKNRLIFHFSSQDTEVDGFKFNIHNGNRLIFHIGMDGHRTGRIFFGEGKNPSEGDPVVFDLHS